MADDAARADLADGRARGRTTTRCPPPPTPPAASGAWRRRSARGCRRGSGRPPSGRGRSPSTRTRWPRPWRRWRCARSAGGGRRTRDRCSRWRGRSTCARIDVRRRVVEAQRAEDHLGHVLGVRLAGDGLDDLSEQRVADVGVLEALVAGEHRGVVGGDVEQRRAVGERPEQLPEVAVPAVAHDAGTVGQQLADDGHRRAGCRRASASQDPTGSSRRRRPCSTSRMTAVAVNVLECEAMRKRWRGVSGVPDSTSARPWALDSTTSPSWRIAACTPGMRSNCWRNASHESMYAAASTTASLVCARIDRDASRTARRVVGGRASLRHGVPSTRRTTVAPCPRSRPPPDLSTAPPSAAC